jgi:ATP-binding protein involved in chromosome partitioning
VKVIAVGSGKGGVGKSTVSLNLALALSERGPVGLLDADFYGPDIPLMVGLARLRPTEWFTFAKRGGAKVKPARRYGLVIQSVGFILAEAQPNILTAGSMEMLALQLARNTDWGDAEVLVVDLPPGTADIQQILMRLIPFDTAVIVVTPQDAAHLDARKVVEMYRGANVKVAGGIENMAGFRCPHCGEPVDVFPRVVEERSIWAAGVDKLGEIPLDPEIGAAGDAGVPLLVAHPESPQADGFRMVAAALIRKF